MTIQKRLYLSNIFMIIVPVTITIVTAFICLLILWAVLGRTTGLGFSDSEDFQEAQGTITLAVKEILRTNPDDQQERLHSLSRLLDDASMSVIIQADGKELYQYGAADAKDALLITAIDAMGEGGFLSTTDRSLFADTLVSKGRTYQLYLFSTPRRYAYTTLKVVFALSLLILVAVIVLSVYATNLFLTKFVFQKINQPLNILTDGVHQIRDGNLSYRIIYEGDDEFAAICADFNEMAVKLKHSVEQTRLHEESHKALVAELSHDLRSPLTSIQAYVSGLLDGIAPTEDARHRYLLTIQKKAEEIQHLVSQMLLFSKMELDEYPLHLEPMDLKRELLQFFSEAQPDYEVLGLDVTYELCDAHVKADRDALHRVLTDILDNSVKYKTKQQGVMHVVLSDTGDGYQLSMTDDGPGVASNSLAKLFDLFYRESASRQNPQMGSGLGLAIVAKIIERMGGAIRAELAYPHGLSLLISLPKECEDVPNTDR
ncbi:MAG: HAMP domain-containing sensor histidine kinase [Sphaerochaeta sp.]|uniref:sensor histidine kinase n=2 Tax=Sphaerochaeta sp. TaxID=1972642 RepID=UPI00358656C2